MSSTYTVNLMNSIVTEWTAQVRCSVNRLLSRGARPNRNSRTMRMIRYTAGRSPKLGSKIPTSASQGIVAMRSIHTPLARVR